MKHTPFKRNYDEPLGLHRSGVHNPVDIPEPYVPCGTLWLIVTGMPHWVAPMHKEVF